jgi:hypothetical protein
MTNTNVRLSIAATLLGLTLTSPAAAQDRGPAGTVTLARTDYDQLLDLASLQPRPPDAAPVPAALTRADLRVRVSGGIVRATMSVDGEVFQTGAVKVPLISQATLLDARAGDRPLPLVAEGQAHVAIVTGPAAFSATLEWGAGVTTSPGRGSFVLPVPPAGSATAVFDVPGEQSDLRVSPGLVVRRSSAGGRSIVEATLDPGTMTTVSWSARETGPAAPPRDTRLLSDIKTLITIGDADVRLLSLIDVTVVQGEPASIDVKLPAGYELVGVTGGSLDRSEPQADRVVLFVNAQARRRHQFLLNLERSTIGAASAARSSRLDTSFPTVPAAQRESGEVAIEGIGTLEISSQDVAGLRRMDAREVHASLVSVATQSLLSAFRYQRTTSSPPVLTLNVTRFADAAVLAAIADRAVATTLVTREGRALTEVVLHLRNRAQPFMKVVLPSGASMLSVDVAGAAAKPADGSDGIRVPLLRSGFRPDGTYTVSFVYLNAGTAFAKKGDMQMALPRMDVPVNVVEWELFLPGEYRADRFSGGAIAANLLEGSAALASMLETVAVTAESPAGGASGGVRHADKKVNEAANRRSEDAARRAGRDQDAMPQMAPEGAPSVNVQQLQRRAAGVLPVRIDVPRAGTSHRFVKPLVVDEETVVTFRYQKR